MSQLQPGGIYPVWASVAACGYPAPTSLDPNGLPSGGTAGVPDGTQLQNASTCSSCLPSGDSWDSTHDYLWVASNAPISNLYVPGASCSRARRSRRRSQNSDVETGPGGSGYDH